jgi:hypothetical protein
LQEVTRAFPHCDCEVESERGCGDGAGRLGSGDLAECAGHEIENEAPDVLVRQERGGPDPGEGLAHIRVGVRERLSRPSRAQTGGGLDRASSVKVSIPQSVWWIRTISVVPSSRWLIVSDRIVSSVITPPALRP